ncbi:MAG: hypothetical protein NTW86_25250 [Candidatus Sumerlaeota bacterium]|nr:hypothetical protein [Candidatus Sumerlaeota bacterium]
MNRTNACQMWTLGALFVWLGATAWPGTTTLYVVHDQNPAPPKYGSLRSALAAATPTPENPFVIEVDYGSFGTVGATALTIKPYVTVTGKGIEATMICADSVSQTMFVLQGGCALNGLSLRGYYNAEPDKKRLEHSTSPFIKIKPPSDLGFNEGLMITNCRITPGTPPSLETGAPLLEYPRTKYNPAVPMAVWLVGDQLFADQSGNTPTSQIIVSREPGVSWFIVDVQASGWVKEWNKPLFDFAPADPVDLDPEQQCASVADFRGGYIVAVHSGDPQGEGKKTKTIRVNNSVPPFLYSLWTDFTLYVKDCEISTVAYPDPKLPPPRVDVIQACTPPEGKDYKVRVFGTQFYWVGTAAEWHDLDACLRTSIEIGESASNSSHWLGTTRIHRLPAAN